MTAKHRNKNYYRSVKKKQVPARNKKSILPKGLKFISVASAKTRARYKSSGAIVKTKKGKKGIYIRKRSGLRARIKKGILVEKGGVREEYFIPLSPIEAAAFMGDPVSVVENLLANEYSWILNDHPKEKYYVRLSFATNSSGQDYKADQLVAYVVAGMIDVPDTRTGKIVKTAQQRREEFSSQLVGIRIIFFGQKSKTGESTWSN